MQNIVVEQVPQFIESVLASEKEHFSNAKDPAHCQDHPWKEAIPLFEEGSRAAQIAQVLLSASHLDSFQAAFQQEQTVQYWRQALKILENPPSSESQQQQSSPSQSNQSSSSTDKTPKSMNEILRLIQEMQLEDQPQSGEKPIEEQHTW